MKNNFYKMKREKMKSGKWVDEKDYMKKSKDDFKRQEVSNKKTADSTLENSQINEIIGGEINKLRNEINLLNTVSKAKTNLESQQMLDINTYQITEGLMYRKQQEKENNRINVYDIKGIQDRGLSWNIAFMDNIIRTESYVRNAISWRTTKAFANGIDLNIRDESANVEKIIGLIDELKTNHIKPLRKWFYLGVGYGGSGGLLVIDGVTDKRELLKPLRYKDLKQGQTLSIRPLTRLYQIQPDYSMSDRYITKIGEDEGIYDETELGKPKYYRVSISGDMFNKGSNGKPATFSGNNINTFLVHRSRLIIYNSSPLSWIPEQVEQFFGYSIVDNAIEAIKNYKITLEEILKLLKRSNIPVINMSGLGEVSRAGKMATNKIAELITSYNFGMELGDIIAIGDKDKEDLKFVQAEFRELSNILLDRKKELSAALLAPLSATFKEKDDLEESQNFFAIKESQEDQIRPAYKQIIPIIYKIKYGEDIPEWSFVFRSLEETSEEDKVKILESANKIVNELFKNNLITNGAAHEMLVAASNNVNDMFYEISKYYVGEDIDKDKLFKDFQIEIAERLNWQNKNEELNNPKNRTYNMAESKLKGSLEGGDPKATKKVGIDL